MQIETAIGKFPLSKYKLFFNTSKPVYLGFNPSAAGMEGQGFHFGNSVRRPVWTLTYEETDESNLKIIPANRVPARFLLKCQSDSVPLVPELEKLSLELAALAGLETPEHYMIETNDRQSALLIKCADAPVRGKEVIPVKPVIANATAGATWEDLAAFVKSGSSNAGFDLLGVLERALFAYLIGAYNVGIRKFFFVTAQDGLRKLGPVSGYLPMLLLFSKQIDPQDVAFSFNGKTRKLTVQDFLHFGSSVGLYGRQIDNAVKRFQDVLPSWESWIRNSALPNSVRNEFIALIEQRAGRLMLRRRF